MEGYATWEVAAVLKAAGAERPGVRFCHPSASIMYLIVYIVYYKKQFWKKADTLCIRG